MMYKEKLKAARNHLLISIVILAIFLWVCIKYWFPYPHFEINGGWDGIKIIIPVDFILGPILTFVVFNSQKSLKERILDLSLIGLIQFGVFCFGTYQVYSQRPVVQSVTFSGDIRTAIAEDFKDQEEFYNPKRMNKLNVAQTNPPFVYVSPAENSEEQGGLQGYSMMTGTDIEGIAFLYEAINEELAFKDIKVLAKESREKLEKKEENKKAILQFEKENKGEFFYFPFKAKYGEAIMVLDDKAHPFEYINVKRYKNQ